jgi:hypothetical protein
MKADPGETRNVWDSARPTVKQMAGLVAEWGAKYKDELAVELGRWAGEQG